MLYVAKPELRHERLDYGSLRRVAQELDIHYGYLSEVETGKRQIKRATALRICKYFGCDIKHLFKEGGNYGTVKTRGDTI